MAKSQTATEPAAIKVLKQCVCGATFFQGPFKRGEIVNGAFEPREEIYQCLHCNKVQTIDQMIDRQVMPVTI